MKRVIPLLIIAFVAAIGAYALHIRDSTDLRTLDHAVEESLGTELENVFLRERTTMSEKAVDDALSCIDSDGIVSCGEYQGRPAMYLAALFDKPDTIRSMPNSWFDTYSIDALGAAAGVGAVDALDAMEMRRTQLNSPKIDTGRHPILLAATYGRQGVVDYYVIRGFDVGAKAADGATDVFVSAILGRKEELAISLVEEYGYQVDCSFRFPNGINYAQLAQNTQQLQLLNFLNELCR